MRRIFSISFGHDLLISLHHVIIYPHVLIALVGVNTITLKERCDVAVLHLDNDVTTENDVGQILGNCHEDCPLDEHHDERQEDRRANQLLAEFALVRPQDHCQLDDIKSADANVLSGLFLPKQSFDFIHLILNHEIKNVPNEQFSTNKVI